MRRPQFSLKWLLVLVTFASLLFYLALVRPTIIANKLVTDVESGDRTKHKSICDEYFGIGVFSGDTTLTVDVRPRTWIDVFKGQRRILLVASNPEGQGMKRVVDGNILSTPFGFRNLGGNFWLERAKVAADPKKHEP
jgi:hypothetical protein